VLERVLASYGLGLDGVFELSGAPFAHIRPMETESAQLDLRGLRARREEILGYAAEHGARNVRVLGSIARGELDAESDVDLLVEMEPGRSLVDLVGLWQDLEDLLGTHVDVLSEGGVTGRYARSDATSSSMSMTRATRSMSTSWASRVAPRRHATAAIMQSSIPRGVTPAARQRR
jgi:uncharacterized protein